MRRRRRAVDVPKAAQVRAGELYARIPADRWDEMQAREALYGPGTRSGRVERVERRDG